ncbi:hypothetical protein [Paenibacillus sp. GP183]|uniref:hypothetical protein n=1 Tax=Paenibacillus sp. GP183 TaxID=1882751 RepID=UPI00089B4EE3|nr:hypothetical protein [Paenibacillus sp. GP183]SEC53997.1 hypothetical protein SAMN05443246_4442 [Paenibacillus sp. GP183]
MLPSTLNELDQVADECRAMVTKRAALSGTIAAIPIPGADFLADINMLSKLIPKINKRFGLSEQEISNFSTEKKTFLYSAISSVGSRFIGRSVTHRLIMHVLKKMGIRYSAKLGVKYVPLLGTATAGILSFSAMKYLGNAHVNECYQVAKKMIEMHEPLDFEMASQ